MNRRFLTPIFRRYSLELFFAFIVCASHADIAVTDANMADVTYSDVTDFDVTDAYAADNEIADFDVTNAYADIYMAADADKKIEAFSEGEKCRIKCFAQCLNENRTEEECSKRCNMCVLDKFSSSAILPEPIDEMLATPQNVTANFSDDYTLNVRWAPVKNASFYVLKCYSTIATASNMEAPHANKSSALSKVSKGNEDEKSFFAITKKPELLNYNVPPEFLCHKVKVHVASVSFKVRTSKLSSAIYANPPMPDVTLALHSLTLKEVTYTYKKYDPEKMVHIMLQYKTKNWVFNTSDIEITPTLKMQSCEKPHGVMAMSKPMKKAENYVLETKLEPTFMRKNCTLMATVHSRSKSCNYSFRTDQTLRINLNCEAVENCRKNEMEVRSADFGRQSASVWWIIGGSVVVLIILLTLITVVFLRYRHECLPFKRKTVSVTEIQDEEKRYTDLPKQSIKNAQNRTDNWEVQRRHLIVYSDKKLGSGAFGAVYLGRLSGGARGAKGALTTLGADFKRVDDCDVAVKMLPESADNLSKAEFLHEIELMKTLGYHERLVNILACITASEPYCLVVEFCADGNLLLFLRARCEYMLKLNDEGVDYTNSNCDADFDADMIMTIQQLLQFVIQISCGLEYLSQKGFVHRDVAARNVLVHDKRCAKIGDFGLCRLMHTDDAIYTSRGGRLPLKWMSPEAIRRCEFTAKSDVWSFGVLMFEIITLGGTPYPKVLPSDMLDYLTSGQRMSKPDNCPDAFYNIMCACWALRADDRPDFETIRRRLSLQLEEITDDYLKLDAQKDYYQFTRREEY